MLKKMEFSEIKIGEAFIHKALVLTKKDSFTGLTLSGIPFFMEPNDIVEIYNEEGYENKPTT